jgi:hypothetical protein
MLKKVGKKAQPDLDLAQDWRHIALCSGSRTPSPLRAFDLTPANEPHTHIYSRALSGRGNCDVIARAFFFSLLHSASSWFFSADLD